MVSKLLKKQLKRLGISIDNPPSTAEDWKKFLTMIEQSYSQYEEGRYYLERALEISSKEMIEKIEEEKEMNLKLIQAQKMSTLGTLSAGIAHELNNPLTGILNHASLLIKKDYDEVKQKDKLERIVKLSNRMSTIISHLKKLSHKGNSSPDTFDELDISDPILDTFELLESQLRVENIEFEFINNLPDKKMINGNYINLESVFQNLITNSLHSFSKSESFDKKISITLNYDSDEEKVIVWFRDNAMGMDEETRKRLFEPFFSTKAVGVGTGLGMSISFQIIKDHRGKINCKSLVGKGTIFKIIFPELNENQNKSGLHDLSDIGVIGIKELEKETGS